MKVTKEIKTIGTLVIVLALISTFYMDDYRQVLEDYPDRQLILITGWDDKVELIGRSHDENVEFYKWKYQDGKTKAYLGSDLVDTVSWQVYVGSKQVKGAYTDLIDYEYNDNLAKVVMKRYVYYDSRRTNFAGVLNMELEIYPNTNKETVTWVPANDSIRYNLLSTHATDDYGQRGKLNGTRVDLEKLQISWNDSADQVSSAYRYLNGKVKIRYKSQKGVRVIDPTIKLGGLIIEYWQEDFGDKKYTSQCLTNCDLPIAVTFNKNKVINLPSELTGKFTKKKETSKGLKEWGIELGSNISFEESVWMPNWVYENETIINESGTFEIETGTDFGEYVSETKYKVVWMPVSFPVSVQKDVTYNINLWGVKHIEFGNDVDAVFSIFGIDTWELAWWNSTWDKKKPVDLVGTGTELTNYQVGLNVTYDSDMQTDFDDLRFVNSTETGELNFWLEEKVDSSWAYVWVEVPTIAASGNTTIYMYYNNSGASSASDITTTFLFGDDFEYDDTITNHGWTFQRDEAGTTMTTSTDGAVGGTRSLKVTGTTSAHFDIISALLSTAQTGNVTVTYSTNTTVDPTGSGYNQQAFLDRATASPWAGGSCQYSGWIDNSGNKFQQYADAVWNTIYSPFSTNTWYKQKSIIDPSANKIMFYVDDVYKTTVACRYTVTNTTAIQLFNGNCQNENYYIDNVYVAKYASPEPTYGFGSEESSNTASTVTANVTKPDTVYTNTDWLVNMTVTDPDADTLSAYVQFYVNDTLTGSVVALVVTNNTNTLVATLAQGNYSYNDVLIAETWAGDGTVNTSKINLTTTVSEIRIIGACHNFTEAGETYQMNQSISNSATSYCMNLSVNNITFDCNGHTLDGNDDASNGIYLVRGSAETTNVTIKNCIITDWNTNGIRLENADSNNISNVTLSSNPDIGIGFTSSDSNTIEYSSSNSNTYGFWSSLSDSNTYLNFTTNSNTNYGFYIQYSDYNTLTNIETLDNLAEDIFYFTSTTVGNNDCNSVFTNVIGTESKPIVFYNSSVNLQDWNNNISEIILCNADNSVINNLVMDRTGVENNALLLVITDSTNITNSRFTDLEFGLRIRYSDSNIFENITLNSNYVGISSQASDSNTYTNITSYSNTIDGVSLGSSHSNILSDITSYSNSDDGIQIQDGSSNTISNSNVYLNTDDGIYIDGNYNTISDTNIYSQSGSGDYGLYIDDDHNIVENVSSYSNYYGMRLDSTAQNNTIYDSSIYSNTYGLYVYGAGSGSPNIIYNNLFNQTNNVLFGGGGLYDNTWNTTQQAGTRIYSDGTEIGGNYWTNSTSTGYSDNCTDTDTNGFCDDYYNLTTGNIDWLPLSDKYSIGGDTCDCPASGNMVIDCSENCDIESCDLQTNNFTASGSGTVTGFRNLYNYTWGMIQCTNGYM